MAWEGIERPITKTSVRFRPGQNAKYVPNHGSFGAFLRSDQMRDVTEEVAKDISALARSMVGEAAENEPEDVIADTKRRFRVRRNAGLMKVSGNLRVKVEVFNNAEGSALLEFGARQIKRRRMLGRAGATFGDFKPEDGPK